MLKTWLLGVTAAALAVSLAQALTPEGTIKKIGRLVGGLVLLLAATRPLLQLEGLGWNTFAPAAPAMTVEEAGQSGEEVMKTLIAQKAGAYIVDKGQSLGLQCEVRVGVALDGSGWPVPWEAEISGAWTAEQKKSLSRAVEEDLGIPVERQSFREEGT
ncbi:MAG: stage III sporulation protein AF [Oscillospiraceae bacterium]|jgi:hypothetical protein|nr:stage III sporulation protein AF [Oscillospiraceae bacterium]